jgi:predicted nuclease of predicted toxin-antitoxin system
MKILLDECTPNVLRRQLPNLKILTVQELGWSGISNGKLLALAEEQFDVFITTDQNLKHQQNLFGRRLAIIELPTNQVPAVAALAPAIERALATISAGDFVQIPLP